MLQKKTPKTNSVWGKVEEGTGKEKITIFGTSESHNKTALRQSLFLALSVKTKKCMLFCCCDNASWHGDKIS